MASQYSILVDVDFNTSQIQQKLRQAAQNTKINFDVDSGSIDQAAKAAENLGLTFQEANLIMSKSLDIITSMVDEVYALDSSLTEFKKVSDLSGASLENYTNKLSEIGKTVARTGKPKSQARSVGMVNQH